MKKTEKKIPGTRGHQQLQWIERKMKVNLCLGRKTGKKRFRVVNAEVREGKTQRGSE
jgi:hypothetical protein